MTDPQTDVTGRQLGDYQLLRRLGQGGMAQVYLAQQQSLQRRVALKILKPEMAHDETCVRRFHHEAQAAATLVHANIVQIYEVGQFEKLHYIAQEYVPGRNLKQLLDRHGSLEPGRALEILRQVTLALIKAAQHGIVHRDIKPENVLLDADGNVKVADFGLARMGPNHQSLELTAIGMTMGTPLYMSPEQVEGRPLDARSDIYSLGVTAYYMLAGRPPFIGETPLSVAMLHVKGEPVPLSQECAAAPPDLCRIVHRMLAKSPAERYETPEELLRELELVSAEHFRGDAATHRGDGILGGLNVARFPATRQLAAALSPAGAAAAVRRRRWRRLAWLGVAMVVGALLGVTLRPPPPLALLPGEVVPAVPRKENANAQYLYAVFTDTEEAWRSVLEYFPPEGPAATEQQRYVANRGKCQLARWYMEHDQPQKALVVLEQLEALNEAETEFRAYGLAGQAIIYAQQGDREKLTDKLSSALSLADHLDPSTRTQLERVGRRYFQR